MEGLELRIQALHKAGFTVKEYDWDGLRLYSLHDANSDILSTLNATPEQAWRSAPSVETSIDTALEWLKLDPYGFRFYSYPILKDIWFIEMVKLVKIGGSSNFHLDHKVIKQQTFIAPNNASAICQAYIAWKELK